MSTQIEINEDLIKYLQNLGYRKDTVVDKLEKETKALGSVAQMQIAKEQGQFLEIIVKTSKAKSTECWVINLCRICCACAFNSSSF